MRWRGPLSNSYPAAAALVGFSLVPFLMLSAAVMPLTHELSKGLGLSPAALDITFSIAYAAYAVGTVLAVQFAVHLPQRRMLLGYLTAFVVAAILAAVSPSGWVFAGAFVAEGLCTSLMLIAAVPPLVTGWPPSKMPITGTIMNLCVFGAVAVGPTIGYLQLGARSWHPLFWVVSGLALAALVFAVLTFEDVPGQDRDAPWDFVAIALALGGCVAAFFGAGELQASGKAGPLPLVPLFVGAAMVVYLVIYQFRAKRPLMPVKQLATIKPAMGVLVAMFASAASFSLMELVMLYLQHRSSPGRSAVLFLPELGAAVLTAAVFGLLFRTRFTPVLALGGMVCLVVGGAVLTSLPGRGSAVVALGTGLVGLGVGASVSPALFIAGFSLRSAQIQRLFALIELLRGVTAFLVAPVVLFLASTIGSGKPDGPSVRGMEGAVWVCLAIAAAGGLLSAGLWVLGGARLAVPDLERWKNGEPAWESPPLRHSIGTSAGSGRPS